MTDLISLRLAQPSELPIAIEIDAATEHLFAELGIHFEIGADHPFVVAEHARWRRAAEGQGLYWAIVDHAAVGFAALNELDGHAHLEQLAVRPEYGRRGIGRALIEHACELARSRAAREIWLTTYGHVPFNRPLYERAGFAVVAERDWGPAIRQAIAEQRAALPNPEQRVAMRRLL